MVCIISRTPKCRFVLIVVQRTGSEPCCWFRSSSSLYVVNSRGRLLRREYYEKFSSFKWRTSTDLMICKNDVSRYNIFIFISSIRFFFFLLTRYDCKYRYFAHLIVVEPTSSNFARTPTVRSDKSIKSVNFQYYNLKSKSYNQNKLCIIILYIDTLLLWLIA